jgi:hypothetical protein
MQLIYCDPAVGTTHTNSTDEAVLASYAFPANFWQVGKVVKARALVSCASTNGTDTATVVARFGAAALTGTSIGTSTALDVANGDLNVIDVELVCRSVGSAGVIVATVLLSQDAAGTAAQGHGSVVSSVDTTAATYLGITADWSAASASNQIAAQCLSVFEAAAK